MSTQCYLLDLPDELLLSMAIKLTLTDLLSFMHSCRRFHVLIRESSLMQYLIRTMRNGLHDPLISDMSIPQRAKALEIWERAWLDLSMNEQSQRHQLVAIGLDDLKQCTIQNGILIKTQFNNLYQSGSYFYLDFFYLLDRSKAATRINLPGVPVGEDAHVQSWTYAPESDLMVIVYGQKRSPTLRFYEFSTGSNHPSANYFLEFVNIWATRATCVECCGDNMIMVILDGEDIGGRKSDFVFLIEWRTGRITMLRKALPRTYGALVTFLSPDVLVFALRDTFALEVCKLIRRASSGAAPVLQTLCSLKLPTLLSGQQIDDIRLSQPSTLSTTHPSFSRRSLSAFPFRSDPNDDILAFDVYFRANYGRRIMFVARRRALLSLAIPSDTDALPPTSAWEDWGPRTTHWMELDPLNDSISISGSRCVLVKYSHLRNHYVLDLRDFNPYRSRARSAQNKSAATPGVASLTVLSAQACFEEDVVSELPFWSIRKENVGRHVLLDDEWIAEVLWDEDAQAVIEFHTVTSSAELFGR